MMKTTSVALAIVILLLFAGCESTNSSSSTNTSRFDSSLALNIVINLNTYGAFSELDAFQHMKDSLEDAYTEAGWKGEVVFHRYPARNIQGQRLELHLSQWAREPLNTIVCRYLAVAQPPGSDPIDLGVFVGRSTELAASDDQLIEQFKNAASDAHTKLYNRIAQMTREVSKTPAMGK